MAGVRSRSTRINIDCSSDEENNSKQEKQQQQSSSDSSDSETEVPGQKRRSVRRQRTTRGLASLLDARKNDRSPPSPDDRRDGLYSRQVANIWNKVTLAKTSAMKDQVEEEKEKAVITESFSPKKTGKDRRKNPQRIKKERRKKKKEPETVNISDEENQTQNNSYRERSPTPPPTPTPDDNPTKKPRMARGCKKALNNLETLKKKVESGVFDDDDDDVMIVEDVPPCTPESQKEINVKIRSRTGIQRFLMKRGESFHRMMQDMASREGVAPDRLFFVHGDRTIYDYDSPTSIQLNVADILECLVKNDASSSNSDDADAEDPDAFNVTIQGKSYKSKHTFRITKTQPLEKIMREYAQKMAVRFEQLAFRFDGVTLDPRQTPGDVDMEDEECIDVTGL